MLPTGSVDDLFRQKTLPEIHDVLKQTRGEVERKKQELRELVGDHYRSVLESSDHIRAMSESAEKIAVGADKIEELISEMRALAASPPTFSAGAAAAEPSRASGADLDYRLGIQTMALLEVPETVRGHLGAHEFIQAARAAMVDASHLQDDVEELLMESRASAAADQGFDTAALVRQQAAAFRGLPRQIAASCLDAFSAAALEPVSLAESFVVHLLLDRNVQPAPLLRLFLDRRTELLRSLLGGAAGAGKDMSCGSRLASAAMAYEGTVVLCAGLCRGGADGQSAALREALAAVRECAPDSLAAEERAAIEGRKLAAGVGELRRRVDSLGGLLQDGAGGSAALAAEMAKMGAVFAREWAPAEVGSGAADNGRSLRSRFARVVASALSQELRTCAALGEMLRLCTERIQGHRRALEQGAPESWPGTWRRSCGEFCPGWVAPGDALSVLTETVEATCAELVRDRVGDLKLDLVSADEDDARTGSSSAAAEAGDAELRLGEEAAELRRESHLRVQQFDELLGGLVADLEHVARGGQTPADVLGALLDALQARLAVACDKVRPPPAAPLWPAGGREGGRQGPEPAALLQLQRRAARVAIALDALLGAALEGSEVAASATDGPTHLQRLLRTASSSGVPSLARQAKAIADDLRVRCQDAHCAWARLVVRGGDFSASLASFWRLGEDEVAHACGWGSARFTHQGAVGEEAKAVPVPVQASPFVFERLALGARKAAEVGGSSKSPVLVAALKAALGELLAAAYEAGQPVDLAKLKRSGMSHLLQWLFDLHFLRIALSSAEAPSGAMAAGGGSAYEALDALLLKAEATTLSDPVDRLLYQDVLKSSVKASLQGVKVVLAPFFLHNPLFGFHFQGAGAESALAGGAAAAPEAAGGGDGFEIQATNPLPFRPVLPRFPLLPVAMTSAYGAGAYGHGPLVDGSSSAAAAAQASAAARAAGPQDLASSLMQQVGSGLGSLGLGLKWPVGGGGPRPGEPTRNPEAF